MAVLVVVIPVVVMVVMAIQWSTGHGGWKHAKRSFGKEVKGCETLFSQQPVYTALHAKEWHTQKQASVTGRQILHRPLGWADFHFRGLSIEPLSWTLPPRAGGLN